MAFEQNAEQIESLALETSWRRPRSVTIDHGLLVIGAKHAQAQPLIQ